MRLTSEEYDAKVRRELDELREQNRLRLGRYDKWGPPRCAICRMTVIDEDVWIGAYTHWFFWLGLEPSEGHVCICQTCAPTREAAKPLMEQQLAIQQARADAERAEMQGVEDGRQEALDRMNRSWWRRLFGWW